MDCDPIRFICRGKQHEWAQDCLREKNAAVVELMALKDLIKKAYTEPKGDEDGYDRLMYISRRDWRAIEEAAYAVPDREEQ